MFADDVTLHSSSADMNVIENNLNCDIEKIGAWCLQNRFENKLKQDKVQIRKYQNYTTKSLISL